jgi:hypothetical protein
MRCALLTALLMAVSAGAFAQETTTESPAACADSVVMADITHYDPTPLPEREQGVFVIRWPWKLTAVVRENLAGAKTPRRITIRASLHVEFNPQIKHFVMFLGKGSGREYTLEGFEYRFIRDARGRHMMPIEAPMNTGWLSPEGHLPSNYEALLRPVKYRAKDAWWLKLPTFVKKDPTDYPWGTVHGDYIVADRGLFLTDMLAHLKASRCPPLSG